MSFFPTNAMSALNGMQLSDIPHSDSLQRLHLQLCYLHESLYPQMHIQNLNLYAPPDCQRAISCDSACTIESGGTLLLDYGRSRGLAELAERLMGRESQPIETQRHPVIELRLVPDYFVIELVLSQDAWLDQENLLGKLTIPRHRQTFYELLQRLEANYRIGFWSGLHLSEIHLTAARFQQPSIMDEWMSTFAPGKDWFRLGIWYPPESDVLVQSRIEPEIMRQMRLLYPLYEFLLWTGDNNYRDFYQGLSSPPEDSG